MLQVVFPAYCTRRREVVSSKKCLECFLANLQLRWAYRLRYYCVRANLCPLSREVAHA